MGRSEAFFHHSQGLLRGILTRMIPQGATPGHVHCSLYSQKDWGFCWLRRFSLECMGTYSAFGKVAGGLRGSGESGALNGIRASMRQQIHVPTPCPFAGFAGLVGLFKISTYTCVHAYMYIRMYSCV